VYLSEMSDVAFAPDPIRIADLATPIPGGTGSFTGFTAVSSSLGHTAFLGTGSGGQAGIYLASVLTKVIAVGDTLEGKVVSALHLGRDGLDGDRLAFGASFTDGTEGVFVTRVAVSPFAAFQAKVEIDRRRRPNRDAFEVQARFTLGAGSNGVNIATEAVSLQLTGGRGTFAITIPAGSFKQDEQGQWKFAGVIDGVRLGAVVRPLLHGGFELLAVGDRADLTGLANPLTITLAIGDDGGSTTVRARFN
jgi:hypothetical protein